MSRLARPVLPDLKVLRAPRAPKARSAIPALRTSKARRLVRLALVTTRRTWRVGAAAELPVLVPALARSVACPTRLRGGSRPGRNSLLWDTARGLLIRSSLVLAVTRVPRLPQVPQEPRAPLDKADSRQTKLPTTRVPRKSPLRLDLPLTGSP
jgi:hypothetical protein